MKNTFYIPVIVLILALTGCSNASDSDTSASVVGENQETTAVSLVSRNVEKYEFLNDNDTDAVITESFSYNSTNTLTQFCMNKRLELSSGYQIVTYIFSARPDDTVLSQLGLGTYAASSTDDYSAVSSNSLFTGFFVYTYDANKNLIQCAYVSKDDISSGKTGYCFITTYDTVYTSNFLTSTTASAGTFTAAANAYTITPSADAIIEYRTAQYDSDGHCIKESYYTKAAEDDANLSKRYTYTWNASTDSLPATELLYTKQTVKVISDSGSETSKAVESYSLYEISISEDKTQYTVNGYESDSAGTKKTRRSTHIYYCNSDLKVIKEILTSNGSLIYTKVVDLDSGTGTPYAHAITKEYNASNTLVSKEKKAISYLSFADDLIPTDTKTIADLMNSWTSQKGDYYLIQDAIYEYAAVASARSVDFSNAFNHENTTPEPPHNRHFEEK